MNILIIFLMIVGGAAGIISTLGIIVSMFVVLFYKCYRKLKYNISLFD